MRTQALYEILNRTPIGRTLSFVFSSLAGSALVGWWISELTGNTVNFSLMLESPASIALIVYAILYFLFIRGFYNFDKNSENRTKYIEAIWKSGIKQANTKIENGEYDDLTKIEEILGVNR